MGSALVSERLQVLPTGTDIIISSLHFFINISGTCFADDACEEGLFCFQRMGYEIVPGCLGPGIPAQSYCYDPFDDPLAIGLNGADLLGFNENSKCNEKSPCEKCRGECNDDEGCVEGLFCYRRNGFEPVPGCAGQVGRDYFEKRVLCLFSCF